MSKSDGEKKRVLIVDDDKVVRTVLAKIAERLGAEVAAVSDPAEVIKRVKNGERFDLIIADLVLPQQSGWDLLDELKRHSGTADIPVIIVTGANLSPEETDKLLTRACAVVRKGRFEVDKFQDLLNDVI